VRRDRAERLRHNVAMLQQVGVNTQVITAQELQELQPACQVGDLVVAAYEPESGYADPRATTTAFMQRAQQQGAILREGVMVTGLRTAGGRIVGVDTNEGPIDAPIVVVMDGQWSGRMLETVCLIFDFSTRRE